ncbi:MAG TPA: hypothetical protein VF796_10520 [Humisphaera sp.]
MPPPSRAPRPGSIRAVVGTPGDVGWLVVSGVVTLRAGLPSTRWDYRWDLPLAAMLAGGFLLLNAVWLNVGDRPAKRWAATALDLAAALFVVAGFLNAAALVYTDPGFPRPRWRAETLSPACWAAGVLLCYTVARGLTASRRRANERPPAPPAPDPSNPR